MAWVRPALTPARRRDDAEPGHDRSIVGAIARRRGENVALAINDTNIRGIELGRLPSCLGYRRAALAGKPMTVRISRRGHLGPGAIGTDHLASLARIIARQ